MCSYNRVKGLNASDNRWLDVLRTKFGFTGLVMSDWGAVNDRVLGVSAVLDVEMPYVGPYHDHQIERAVAAGTLREEDVDRCAARVVALAELAKSRETVPFDAAKHHALARESAAQSAVCSRRMKIICSRWQLAPMSRCSARLQPLPAIRARAAVKCSRYRLRPP